MLVYERYLREARGLVSTTILSYAPFVHAFLHHRFGSGRVILSSLRASDVVGFVQHMAPGMNRKRAKIMGTTARPCPTGNMGRATGLCAVSRGIAQS